MLVAASASSTASTASATSPSPASSEAPLARVAALAREDRRDEVGLSQAPEAVEAELGGDQVEVGERALLEL